LRRIRRQTRDGGKLTGVATGTIGSIDISAA
jgi:hypothetical protein